MKSRKLTMLTIFTGCGESQETVFLMVDYVDGNLDFESAKKEVHTARPYWRPMLGDYVCG